MAVSCKVGRPYHKADIDLRYDPDQELYEQFYKACRTLRVFDTLLLSRTLGVDARTVRNWKYHQSFPERRGIAWQVIDWVDRGKPQLVVTQAEHAAGMFQGSKA